METVAVSFWFWTLAGSLYLAAALLGVLWVYWPKTAFRGLSRACGMFAFAIHTAAIAARWQQQGAIPFFQFSEAYYFLLWAIVAAFLTIESFGHVRGFGIFLAPLMVVGYLLSVGFIQGNPGKQNLAGDVILSVHIVLALLAYAFFAISFLIGSMYLFQNRALKKKKLNRIFRTLPSIELLEKWNAGAVAISLPLLTIALLLGAYYAIGIRDRAISTWLSDPMVISSALLWLIAVTITLLRYVTRIRGKKIADLTLIGFAVVVVSLVGAGFVNSGKTNRLHLEEVLRER